MSDKITKKEIYKFDKKKSRKNKSFFKFNKKKSSNDNVDELIIVDKIEKPKLHINFQKILKVLLGFLIIIFLFLVVKKINFNISEMIWKVTLTRGSSEVNNKSVSYSEFAKGIVRISNDGATYINSIGEEKWNIPYNLKEPIYDYSNSYFVIANKNQKEVYVLDSNGMNNKFNTKNQIQKIIVIENNIYILEYDNVNTYVNIYDVKGNNFYFNYNSSLENGGMIIDMTVSYKEDALVLSSFNFQENIYSSAKYFLYNGKISNKNIKTQKEFVDEFSDRYLARVHFFKDGKSFLLYENGIYFLNNNENIEISKHIAFDSSIKSISFNDKYFATILQNGMLLIFNSSGIILSNAIIDFNYDSFRVSDNYIILTSENRIVIYDENGFKMLDKEMRERVVFVAKKNNLIFSEIFVGLIDGVECIRFY